LQLYTHNRFKTFLSNTSVPYTNFGIEKIYEVGKEERKSSLHEDVCNSRQSDKKYKEMVEVRKSFDKPGTIPLV
jgi:hypothetical protein